MAGKPKILYVLLPLEYAYFAGVAKGIVTFCRGLAGLRVEVGDRSGLDVNVKTGRGPVIAAFGTADEQSKYLGSRWPVINVSAHDAACLLPRVIPDNRHAGRLAAGHLLAAGFRDFAFARVGSWFSSERGAGFDEVLSSKGCAAVACGHTEDVLRREIPRLPKSVAIFADSDRVARRVITVCADLGRHVPADVAVMGVDNDPMMCETMTPQMTSVDLNAEKVGFEAARLALAMCGGTSAPGEPILIPPKGVVARESTNTQAVDSPALARAMGLIRQRACERITVADIAASARVPRRTLHRLCREHFGLPVSEVIRRRRIEQAKLLLIETDRTAADVGACCGFSHYGRFHALFRAMTGVTPGVYRSQRRMK